MPLCSKFFVSILVLYLYNAGNVFGQKEAYNWYFGYNAGVTFNTSPPTALGGKLNTREGCATISDSAGNLLFYTDGIVVYNRDHSRMPEGYGLLGDPSSTQSGVIAKQPGRKHIYYIFTVDKEEMGTYRGLQYSVVDMSLQNGLGDVVKSKKNQLLVKPTAEKVVAIKHHNKRDIWIVGHGRNDNIFYVFLLTEQGLNTSYTTYKQGTQTYSRGYLKCSPDGSKLAMANANTIDIFSFDNKTGDIVFTGWFLHGSVYGVEFSPDGSYLYGADRYAGRIYQYDLISKKTSLLADSVPLGALQNGPDGKMYISQYNYGYLGVVEKPDLPAPYCNYVKNGLHLNGYLCGEGLPNFYVNTLVMKSSFTWADTCAAKSTKFSGKCNYTEAVYRWYFGGLSQKPDTATGKQVSYTFDKAGKYKVRLVTQANDMTDTVEHEITILPIPESIAVRKIRICRADSAMLDAGNEGGLYSWSNGAAGRKIWVKRAGNYQVNISNHLCTFKDSVIVEMKDTVVAELGADRKICTGDFAELDAGPFAESYLWNNGARTQILKASRPGKYWVLKINEGCAASDTVSVSYYIPDVKVNKDTALCENELQVIYLTADKGTGFYWQPGGENTQEIQARKAGKYSVNYKDKNGCGRSEEMNILPNCIFQLYAPNVFNPTSIYNPVFRAYGSNVLQFEMKIYNRWGELLFVSRDIEIGWDGSFKGLSCQEGVYLFTITAAGINEASIEKKYLNGTFNLIK